MTSRNQEKRKFFEKLERALFRNKKVRVGERIFTSSNAGGADSIFGNRIGVGRNASSFGVSYQAGTIENRLMRYKEYNMMDNMEPMCVNALDAYAHNSMLRDVVSNHVMIIDTSDEEIKEKLEDLYFSTLDIDTNGQFWVRYFCREGDFIMLLQIDFEHSEGVTAYLPVRMEEINIEWGQHPISKKLTKIYTFREDGVGTTTNSFLAGPRDIMGKDKHVHVIAPFQLLHFSIKGDPAYEPYGKSILEQARYSWKQLRLMEDSMLVYRVVRAPERRIFKIEVGGMPVNEMKQYVMEAMSEIKRIPIADPTTGEINLQYNVAGILEDYVFPQRQGFGSQIDTLPGGQNTGEIQDVEYFKSKLRMSLKVPKAFLEYDEQLATARGLSMEDQRFSANINSIQKVFLKEMYKVGIVHLLACGFDEERIDNAFTLRLMNPSTQEEKDRLEIVQLRNSIFGDIMQNKSYSREYAMRNVLNLTDSEISEIKAQQLEDSRDEFIQGQIAQGNFLGIFPQIQQADQQGQDGKAMMGGADPFGGGGAFGGGGGGLGGAFGGFDAGGGGIDSLDMPTEPGMTPPGEGTLGGGETGMGAMGTAPTAGANPAETPDGGTDTAGLDLLRVVDDKLIAQKPKKGANESFDRSSSDLITSKKTFEEQLDAIFKRVTKRKK